MAAAVATLLLCRRYAPALLFVITPIGLAVALAAGQAVPLGTGRTDLYLYPGLAMAIALAVDELRKRSARLTALGAGLVIALAVITFNPVAPYPPRDGRPLVAELERRASPSDNILLRPDDDFAFALYTNWPVTFVRASVPTDFAAPIDHPNVHVPCSSRLATTCVRRLGGKRSRASREPIRESGFLSGATVQCRGFPTFADS